MWWSLPRSRTFLLTNIRGFRYDFISRIVFWNYKSFKVTLVFVKNPHTIRNILYTVFGRFWQSTLIPATTSTTTTFVIEFVWCQRTFSIKIRGSRQACVPWKMVFCYQNCSDLLWEKIVLVIKKILEIRAWRPKIFGNKCLFNLFQEVSQI